MRYLTLKNLLVVGMWVASLGSLTVVNAQTVRHDFLDAKAAQRDIWHLKQDRARALHFHNWGKVAQDDRLISSDRFWIMKDKNRIRRAGDVPPR